MSEEDNLETETEYYLIRPKRNKVLVILLSMAEFS